MCGREFPVVNSNCFIEGKNLISIWLFWALNSWNYGAVYMVVAVWHMQQHDRTCRSGRGMCTGRQLIISSNMTHSVWLLLFFRDLWTRVCMKNFLNQHTGHLSKKKTKPQSPWRCCPLSIKLLTLSVHEKPEKTKQWVHQSGNLYSVFLQPPVSAWFHLNYSPPNNHNTILYKFSWFCIHAVHDCK